VQFGVFGHALDRGHLLAFAARGQRQTTKDASTIDVNRAGATRALVTSLLRPGQAKALAQDVKQLSRGSRSSV
jgi:hypothetical protein